MTPAGSEDLPVLFVSGKGRSGSTLLSMVLGELDGVTNGGELRFTWQRGMVEDRNCGCGRPFSDCPTWQAVTARLQETSGSIVPEQVGAAHDAVFRWGAMPRLLVGGRAVSGWSALQTWTTAAGDLYRSLAEGTGARLVVDSSKWPVDPGLLGRVPGISPVVLHLVRDPRAVAWSWQRRRDQHDLAEVRPMDRFGPGHSATSWSARNLVVEAAARRARVPTLRLRYEDFVADPAGSIGRIGDVVGMDLDPTGVIDGTTVQRSVNHTVAGNPARFGDGPTVLRADDEWQGALPRAQRWAVTALTAPLLARYGYPLRTRPTR